LRVVETVEDIDMPQRGLDQRGRGGLAVLALQILAQGAGIDADAYRDATVPRAVYDRPHFFVVADVAGVDSQAIDTVFGHLQRDLVIEMDVRDQRHADLCPDFPESLGRLHARHRDAHDIG